MYVVKKGHNYVHEVFECPLDLGIEKTKNKEIISLTFAYGWIFAITCPS